MADKTPIQPGDPVPVVPTTPNQQWRRFLAFATATIGAALHVLSDYGPQITAHYPGVKWVGDVVFLAGLVWASWQKFTDVGTVTPVNMSDPRGGAGG